MLAVVCWMLLFLPCLARVIFQAFGGTLIQISNHTFSSEIRTSLSTWVRQRRLNCILIRQQWFEVIIIILLEYDGDVKNKRRSVKRWRFDAPKLLEFSGGNVYQIINLMTSLEKILRHKNIFLKIISRHQSD